MSFYRKSYRPRRGGEEPEKCADPAKARARALDALSAREMTSTQLYERLCARFTEQAAAAAVAEMVELDYVNDDRYAETRAHGLLMARKSRRAAAQNLRQKGLNSREPGAGSCRRAGGQPLPQEAGRRPPRPCGGSIAAPGVCLCGHQGGHPADGRRVIEREYYPL